MNNLKNTLIATMLTACACMTSQAFASNIVINGNFETGNTGFSSLYTLGDGSSTALYPEGKYEIGSNPHDYHPAFASITAQDGNKMMIVNGAPQANITIWSENGLAVDSDTTYFFSTWVSSVTPGAPANLSFSINGVSIGSLQATSSSAWQQFYTTWNSGTATSANIALVNLNTAASGNDFALDNIAFDTVAPTSAVPEPSSIALLGLGMGGALLARRRKQKA